jgi:hypothetical protein
MASNLDTVMTHAEAVEHFDECVLPWVIEQYEQDGVPDLPARREAWNDWTDGLCKDGEISDWQYENWSQADSCDG